MRAAALLFVALAACSSRRVPEDAWWPEAEILCQEDRCSRCRGTRGVACFECHGDGEVRCTSCRGDGRRTCSACGGDGERKGRSCSSCGGDGRVRCSSCGGDGEESCDVCGGSGRIACLRRFPVLDPPATRPEDAWPANNYQDGGAK